MPGNADLCASEAPTPPLAVQASSGAPANTSRKQVHNIRSFVRSESFRFIAVPELRIVATLVYPIAVLYDRGRDAACHLSFDINNQTYNHHV